MKAYKKATAKVIREPKHNIRIKLSDNPLKLATARVCADWLSAPERSWTFTGSVDENSARIIHYLRKKFMDFEWIELGSQTPFETLSPEAGVVVEVKSMKRGSKTLLANASLYPDRVRLGDVLPVSLRGQYEAQLDKWLDVLVVCVDREGDYIYDYAIVDGTYWGVTYEDYLSCKDFFGNINSPAFLEPLLQVYNEYHEKATGVEASFVTKLLNNQFGDDFRFNLRKLIMLPNPVHFGLDTAGYWGINN